MRPKRSDLFCVTSYPFRVVSWDVSLLNKAYDPRSNTKPERSNANQITTNPKVKFNLVHPVNPVCDLLHDDRQKCLFYLQPLAHRLKHAFNFDVHTDPLRT